METTPTRCWLSAAGRRPRRPLSMSSDSDIEFFEGVTPIGELRLHHGGVIHDARLAWRLMGARGAPVVVAMGGISAHRRTHAVAGEAPGWWERVVGAGCAIDTGRLRLLTIDYLGGLGDSSRGSDAAALSAISPYDQAEALHRLCERLPEHRAAVAPLRAIVGASYGGMVALAYAERFAPQVAELFIISAAARSHPMATAWRSLQRNIVRFAQDHGAAEQGLQLARALAMSTYRTSQEFAQRFAGPPRFEQGIARFPVEDYLLARGADYSVRYSAMSFLCLSESIDLHAVTPESIRVPTRALGVLEDQLVPIDDMRNLCGRLPRASLQELSSPYGHDAFLKEYDFLRQWLAALQGDPA